MLQVLLVDVLLRSAGLPPSPSHLEPCRPAIEMSEVGARITSRVYQALDVRPWGAPRTAVFIVRPSFAPEHAMQLTLSDDGDGLIVSSEAKRQIGEANALDIPVPGDPRAYIDGVKATPAVVPITRAQRVISRATAELVLSVLQAAAKGAHYPERARPLLDGTSFTLFVSQREIGTYCGSTHSPAEGSLPARIVALGELLYRFPRDTSIKETALATEFRAFGMGGGA